MFALEGRLVASVVMAGLDTLHRGRALFVMRKGVWGFTTGCPHRHAGSMPHPHATSPRCPPTHTVSAAPRGQEWSPSGQTRWADACPRERPLGCRSGQGSSLRLL